MSKKWLFFAIILLAILLRLWGIDFGLPYIYHPDESRYLISAQHLFKTGDINPHSLPDISISSFVYVINALAYIPYYLVGKVAGIFNSRADIAEPMMIGIAIGVTPMPSTFLLGRFVTTIFSILSILIVFLIPRALMPSLAPSPARPLASRVGLLAALLMAISPTNIIHSKFITPDTFVTFFVVLAFWAGVQVWKRGHTTDYIIAGLAIGFAASAKINGVLIALPVMFAHFLRTGVKGQDPRLLLTFALSGVGFLLGSPFIFGDYMKVLKDFFYEAQHYSTGHAGGEGNALTWYLTYLLMIEGLVSLLALLEIIRGIYSHSKETLLLALFSAIYFIFISSFVVRTERMLLPLMPFIFLLASSFLVQLFDRISAQRPNWSSLALTAPVILVILIWLLSQTIETNIKFSSIDGREQSRRWIEQNIPSGSKIALEAYSPYLDPKHFSVHTFAKITDNTPEWYIAEEFEYLVFSQEMFGRFFDDPEKYASDIAKYEALFSSFESVKLFTDGGYEVRLYHVTEP